MGIKFRSTFRLIRLSATNGSFSETGLASMLFSLSHPVVVDMAH